MRRDRKQGIWKKMGLFAIIIFLAAGSLWYFCVVHLDHKDVFPNSTDMEGSAYPDGSGIVTATGVTQTGIDTVTFAIDYLGDTHLYIEDVYISDGDTVTAGEAYIKFTDDSIEKARAELEKAVQDTELAFRSRVISIGEDKIQAKYTYDTALLEAKCAPQVYQDTLTRLEMQLLKAEKASEEAQEKYNAYFLAVENNTFYDDYQIEKLKKAYDDAYDLFASRRAYWEVTQEELDKNISPAQSDRQWIIRTVALLKDEMTVAYEKYEQAKQGYQREIEGAELKLQILLNQSERAQQELVDAQTEYQQGSLHAKTVYELAVARGQVAESEYNVCLMSLDGELERLRDARDKAVENKALFEEMIGDGYLYTERAGTVFAANAEKGQALTGGEQILAYSNPEEIIVSVTMPERNAELLFAGEKASVTIADCGTFDGVVEAVQPITAPDGKTYAHDMVIVSTTGDSSMIEPGQTASVVFEGDAIVSPMYDLDICTGTGEGEEEYLRVVEVYVEAGQRIAKGDPVCQFAQDSVEGTRKVLTRAQTDAQRALMKAQTSYHVGVLEAGLSHNEAMVGRSLAQTVYDNTIAKFNSGMVAKMLETEQLLTDIYHMQTEMTDDAHQRQNADVARAYAQAKKQAENAKECFVTRQVEAAQTLQAAKDSYETFFDQLESSNQQIADKVEKVYTLQEEILRGRQLMEKELLTAEQTRISAQTEGEIAGAKYAGVLKEYEYAVQKAQSDLERATQKLDDFNRFVGDGTLYAADEGLVTNVGCKKGGLLDDTRKLVSFVTDMDRNSSVVAAVSPGVVEQAFDLDIGVLTDEPSAVLQIEEVLVSSGQQVQKGTALCRVTADSVKNVRTVLQREILNTSRDCEVLEARQKEMRMLASQNCNNSVIDEKYADIVYSNACDALQNRVDDAKEAVDEKQNQVNENLLELTQAQQELAEAQKYLREAEIAVSENYDNRQKNAYYYTMYEKTRETAENMVNRLERQIESLTEKNASLLYEVDEALRAYHQIAQELEREKLAAKMDYDTEMHASETASEWYDIQMTSLDNALQEARGRYRTALQNIRQFDAYIVRNQVLSEYSGILADIMVETGSTVGTNDIFVTIYTE